MQMIGRAASALVIALLLLVAATVSGCGPAEQASAERSPGEVASLYLEAMRGSVSGLRDYNPDTELPEEGVFGNINPTLLEAWGVSASAEQEAQLTAAMLEGLSKVEFTVVDERIDSQSAIATVAIRGLDMASSLETQFESIGGQITDDTTDEAVIALLDKAWREAPLVSEPTNVDFPFTAVSDGRWIADSQSGAALAASYVKMGE